MTKRSKSCKLKSIDVFVITIDCSTIAKIFPDSDFLSVISWKNTFDLHQAISELKVKEFGSVRSSHDV